MYEEFYLDRRYVPDVFRKADRIMEKELKPQRIIVPREGPMPKIKGVNGVVGPLYMTEDWYIKRKKKWQLEKVKERKELQIEMMQLIAQKDLLRHRLGELDPTRKKDAKKIVAINVRIKDIECEIEMIEKESGCKIEELDHGTKLGRFCGRFKWIGRRIKKTVKRFYRRNEELISGLASIFLPILGTLLFKSILKI